MKLQRTTLVLLVSAILLGGVVYFSEMQTASKREATKTTKQPIFLFKEDQIQSLTIYTAKDTLEFERVNEPVAGWRMKTPKEAPASNAAVAFLLDLLVEGKSDRSFTVPTNQRQEYGLDQPTATVKIQLKNKESHRLILGKPDFNNSSLYAQVDPPSQTPSQITVRLVPIDFQYAVNRPLSEWQQNKEKPPEPSPTPEASQPSPTPGQTPVSPTPESSQPSPTPGKTPASSTPKSSQPPPTPGKTPASPTPKSSQPSPTPGKPQTSPTPKSSQPSPTPGQPPASPKPKNSQPSPTPESSQPSPTPKNSPS